MYTPTQKKLLFLCSLGGILEFYDFIIYALLAGYIAENFFKTSNNLTALIATFATFALGYLARPLGGILFGHFGDKLGRKKTFTLSILIMAIATFCIGLVPGYATLGVFAPLILSILRIAQGLSVGGEIPGAIVYISEAVPQKKNLACGIIFFALINGIVLGSLVQAILISMLSQPHMMAWGWRIPFYIGGIFGICSYILRRQLEESTLFQAIESRVEAFPLISVLKQRFVNTLAGTCVVACGAAQITSLFLFTPAYLSKILQIISPLFIWCNTLALFITAVLCVYFGLLADQHNNKRLLVIMSLLTLFFAYPIFAIYAHMFKFFYIALIMSILLTGWAWGIIPGMLSELYPTKIRYSGVALSYNLGFAIFGGLTPLISTLLIYKTHWMIAPSFYLMATAIMCLIALIFTQHSHLERE